MGKMRALVKSRGEPGIWMEEVPIPEPGINDVLIKVHKTAICGTDTHIVNWDAWAQKNVRIPTVIGHEFAGVIGAVGATSMLQSGLDIRPVLTHKFSIAEYQKGFEIMRSCNCGKVVMEWD